MNTLRKNLYKRDRRCHWCSAETWLNRFRVAKALHATVDHVKCKEECATHAEYIAKENKVLACYACNQRRNAEFRARNKRPTNAGRVVLL